MELLHRSFFARDPVTCARELIGYELVWNQCSGIVVETEAYTATNDEACHTFFRRSAREFVAAHRAGDAYVYLNYGMYWLLNVLVKGGEEDGFVLLRALEPVHGIELMKQRRAPQRAPDRLESLCSGPGKLTIALGIDGRDHGRDLCSGAHVGFRTSSAKVQVAAGPRIGITRAAELRWRFTKKGSAFVSGGQPPPERVRRIKAGSR